MLLFVTITYYYYLLLFMGRAVRPRGRGGRPPRAPQRGPSTWGGAGPGPGPGPSIIISNSKKQ